MEEFKIRRKQQMIRFFSSTVITLVCTKLILRRLQLPKYVPSMFELNYIRPPITTVKKDLINAGMLTTGMTLGVFSMIFFGTCWNWNVSTLAELKDALNSGTTDDKQNI
ncbi:Iai11p NDAI_0E04260 [Naumovozyma dairenensis CBS 421]|uniref:Altered inheritance of mitochondria protein 11 n=1 Tax=Naumovozyma dairenensis (strain ATCC 10597 / BCRC 20456 / CBS 421 / NBRC 0211 / NRRL Y-12639) TaxID=1071378 RepID=G0WBX3_NAUDC|nr:hypothetical protein NDAI_0E04260 [Naumovozyma dairenensis CBS 421]CCD25243.1 hypothetical protein NDAI_0E04260 [Naumovozyma dairenensis CBS 421]